MKKDIHPKYYKNAKVICACGNTFEVGSTEEEIKVELCSECHPFYTGKQKLVDTAKRVEKFQAKTAKKSDKIRSKSQKRKELREKRNQNSDFEMVKKGKVKVKQDKKKEKSVKKKEENKETKKEK